MNLLLCIVIHTANILGIFTDPFEFEGDYGPDVNPTRQKVFELVVAKEALAKHLTDSQVKELLQDPHASNKKVKNHRNYLIAQAIKIDTDYGPTLSDLVEPELIQALTIKQGQLQDSGFTKDDLNKILHFLNRYGHHKIFHFFRNNPQELLNLDKTLRDKASREGKGLNLPMLSSTQLLKGKNSLELKQNLLDTLFTAKTLSLTKSKEALKQSLNNLDETYLQRFFGKEANNADLEAFCSPAGQVFFLWIYHALNLHLVSADPSMIEQINKVKDIFIHTLGDPESRARKFKEKLLAANSGVVFTQESDTFVVEALTKDGLFFPVDQQNHQDGCFVFLRHDLWEPNYKTLTIEGYEGFAEGRMNLILATCKETGEKFLLASCHGHSTKAEDGRLQISLVMEKFHQLRVESPGLQLVIGIDANTKTEEDVKALREHLESLGLVGTSVGPTTVKRRMVTAQNAKAGRIAVDEEDYLITLDPQIGSHYALDHPTVGFEVEAADTHIFLPNINNQSDHYPVGATLVPYSDS